jgi:hypothetical protein
MISKVVASCQFWGINFSPKKVEQKTNLIFSQKNEVGDKQNLGPHKGEPCGYGSASLLYPEDTNEENLALEWIVDELTPHIKVIQECGADDIHLDIAIWYIAQCGFAFEPNVLNKVANIKLPLWISCYEDYDED